MKRTWILIALTVGSAAPASAQFFGMPVWNSPSGGSGLTINGDYGKPNSASGGGSAFGGRATLGLGMLSVTAGADSYKPSGGTSTTSFGGDVAFGVIGGPLVPVKVNIQGGAAHGSVSGTGITEVTGAVGIGVTLPMPGISIEPYISPGIRYNKIGAAGLNPGSSSTNFGFAIGANVGFGMLGVHLAYDHSKISGVTQSIFGIGVHLALKVPLGM
jgi:hypothetical protein